MARKEPVVSNEEYVKGRREGVTGSYGEARKGNSVEKTVLPKNDRHDSGAEGNLPEVASSIMRKARRSDGSGGDRALFER